MTKRRELTAEPNVRIEDIMAARDGKRKHDMKITILNILFVMKDLCHMEKTCGTKEISSTRSKLHKVLIPKVSYQKNV